MTKRTGSAIRVAGLLAILIASLAIGFAYDGAANSAPLLVLAVLLTILGVWLLHAGGTFR